MAKRKNPAEPKLDKVDIRPGKIKLFEKVIVSLVNKKDKLSEYLRRTKSAGN
jgi:hypothetical protein